MDRQDAVSAAELTRQVRQALEPALPCGPSLIPLDILTAISLARDAGEPLSVKQLLVILPYSVTGIRYNLSQLVAQGWVLKVPVENDRRRIQLLPDKRTDQALARVRSNLIGAAGEAIKH